MSQVKNPDQSEHATEYVQPYSELSKEWLDKCIKDCKKYRRPSYKRYITRLGKALSLDKRKEFIQYLNQGNKIGEARKLSGITLDEAMGVLNMNLKTRKYTTLSSNEEVR